MEGPTTVEDQKASTHRADYGNHLVGPLGTILFLTQKAPSTQSKDNS